MMSAAHRQRHGRRQDHRRREKLFLHYFQYFSVSEHLAQVAQQADTRLNTPPSARGSSLAGRRISSFVKPAVTSPAVARAVHHDALRGSASGGCGPRPTRMSSLSVAGGVELDVLALLDESEQPAPDPASPRA